MEHSERLIFNKSRRFPGMVDVKIELAPQAALPGLSAHSRLRGERGDAKVEEERQKRVNLAILYQRQGGHCAGCNHHFQARNLTIDHAVPSSKGGSDDIANFQLLCHACNQLKGDGSQELLMTELQTLEHTNWSLDGPRHKLGHTPCVLPLHVVC